MTRQTTREKLTHQQVSRALISHRSAMAERSGYSVPKYLQFCAWVLDQGMVATIYEARETRSKYITIKANGAQYKVRFSNHPPSKRRELRGDCDFFVGRTHTGVRTTEDAKKAVEKFFGLDVPDDWSPIDDEDTDIPRR